MSNKNKDALDQDNLEALARSATPGPWSYNGNCHFGVWQDEGKFYVFESSGHADAAYSAAANPDVILRLIALARRASQVSAAEPAEVIRNNVPGSPHNVCRTIEHNLRKRIVELESELARASEGQAQTSAATDNWSALLVNVDLAAQRTRFESFAWPKRLNFRTHDDQQYVEVETADAWKGWIGHAAQLADSTGKRVSQAQTSAATIPCDFCAGDGWISVGEFDDAQADCANCDGKGVIPTAQLADSTGEGDPGQHLGGGLGGA